MYNIRQKIAKKLIEFIRKNTDKEEEELEKIQYGIEVILINTFKLAILFITAKILGIFNYTFFAFISFAALRTFASGVHAGSNIKCIITNYVVFFSIVYLSIYSPLNKVLLAVVFLISLILVMLYAPADTEDRPIVSKRLRKSLKIKSIACVIILASACFVINGEVYRSLIAFSVLEESILITPMIYYVFGKSYRNYENVKL